MIWLRVDLLTKRDKHPSGSVTVPKLWEGRCFIKAKGLFFWVLKGNIYIPPITMWGSSFLLPTRSRRTHPTVLPHAHSHHTPLYQLVSISITFICINLSLSHSSLSTCLHHTPQYQLVSNTFICINLSITLLSINLSINLPPVSITLLSINLSINLSPSHSSIPTCVHHVHLH